MGIHPLHLKYVYDSLPQAGSLGHDLLKEHINAARYGQSKIVYGLWKHEMCLIQFTLIFDNFGVNYTSLDYSNHLINTLKQ